MHMSRKGRKVSALRRGMALFLSLAMGLSSMPAQALAEAADQLAPSVSSDLAGEVVESGMWGSCSWELDVEGVLTVHSSEGHRRGRGLEHG